MAEKRGGKRKGSGRKASDDPKQAVTIYVATSVIDSYGGKEEIRIKLLNSL